MPPSEKSDQSSAAITRFVILLVIVGVSYLGVSYRKNGKQIPQREASPRQSTNATAKTSPPMKPPQPSIKTQPSEKKDRVPRTSSSKELDSVETESFAPDRALYNNDTENENVPSRKSIRQPTSVKTVPAFWPETTH